MKPLRSLVAVVPVLAFVLASVVQGPRLPQLPYGLFVGDRQVELDENLDAAQQWFYGQRAFPAKRLPDLALASAVADAARLPVLTSPAGATSASVSSSSARGAGAISSTAGVWTELGPKPSDTENFAYDDDSNGSVQDNGFGNVSGRVTALAVVPGKPNTVYLGGANGGVWKTTNGGASWTPVGDRLGSLSIGALAIDRGNSNIVYAGTGEANYNSDAYFGAGLFRSTDAGATWKKVGGSTFDRLTFSRITTGPHGYHVMAATNGGLFRSDDHGLTWRRVLAPGGTADPFGNWFSDVTFLPSAPNKILAAAGSRFGDPNYGLYLSDDAGGTWTKLDPPGFPPTSNLGRISLGVAPTNGDVIFAVIQDAQLAKNAAAAGVLNGVYKTTTGPNGPWQLVANSGTFMLDPNSAQNPLKIGQPYPPGVGSWYNQYVTVDPQDPNNVIVGLEEIYNSTDGGLTWHTIGRYWNVCVASVGPLPPNCNLDPIQHPTTHPDQHAAAWGIQNGKSKLYVGSDGGAWSQVRNPQFDNDHWTNLNATLGLTQPYYAEASNGPNPIIYTGTQDNGNIKYVGSQTWIQVFGGDGGDVAVEPANPDNAYEEYTYMTISKTKTGGRSAGGSAWSDISPPDSGSNATARFISPFDMDPTNKNHLVAIGQHVWESTKGIDTTSSDWTSSYDNGTSNVGTALAVRGSTIYEGWCGVSDAPQPATTCNPADLTTDTPFRRGLASNVGGTWHELTGTSSLPNRYITGIAIDPANTSHIFVTFSGFSRRWINIPGASTGHVFESSDGGAHFTNVSYNLPDIPANDAVFVNGRLIVATDVGVFERTGTSWARLGSGLPNASVLDLFLVPNSNVLGAATHGRGVWTIPLA